jgi:TolA-binding protein
MNRLRWTTTSSRVLGALAVAAMWLSLARPATAQSVTSADIQRLQDQLYDANNEVSRVHGSQDTAGELQNQLDDLRDEVVYLKVKLRKEGSVSRSEYTDLQKRILDVRTRAHAELSNSSGGNNGGWRTNNDPYGSGSNNGVSGGVSAGTADDRARTGQTTGTRTQSGTSAIPSGQEIDAHLETELSSETAQVEQRFEATTVADLYRGDQVLVPAGSTLRGVISSVTKATRTERKGSLTVAFDQITIRGRSYPMRGTVTQALESEGIKGEVGKIGAGAGIGAVIGGIIGGTKGALLGVLIGGGGTIAATEGKDVVVPAGTILRVSLDTPPAIR